MLESVWGQAGVSAALLALIVWLVQATVRGTWSPKTQVDRLLSGKDDVIKLKDEQIALLAADKKVMQATIDAQVSQIGGFSEALGAVQHFFQEVPVVPSNGDTEKVEA